MNGMRLTSRRGDRDRDMGGKGLNWLDIYLPSYKGSPLYTLFSAFGVSPTLSRKGGTYDN